MDDQTGEILGVSFVVLMFALIIYLIIRRASNFSYLINNGILTKAKILDVEKTNMEINGLPVMRVVYEIKYSDITEEVVKENTFAVVPQINDIVNVVVDPKDGNNLKIVPDVWLPRVQERWNKQQTT